LNLFEFIWIYYLNLVLVHYPCFFLFNVENNNLITLYESEFFILNSKSSKKKHFFFITKPKCWSESIVRTSRLPEVLCNSKLYDLLSENAHCRNFVTELGQKKSKDHSHNSPRYSQSLQLNKKKMQQVLTKSNCYENLQKNFK